MILRGVFSKFISWPTLVGLSVACVACAQTDPVPFGMTVTTDATAGKSWYAPSFLEPSPDTPSVSSATRSAVNGFDLAGSGSQAYLAASFYDGLGGHFNGYVRKYSEGSGWSGPGPDFVTVASTVSMGNAGIAGNPDNGSYLAVFSPVTDPGGSGALFYTSFSTNGVWAQARAQRSASGTFPTPVSGVEQEFGSIFAPIFERSGRALIPFVSNAATPITTIEVADPSIGINTTSSAEYAITTAATGAGKPLRRIAAINDGQNRICFFNEDMQSGVRGVYTRCLDDTSFQVTAPVITPATSGAAKAVSAGTGMGFDVATDGAGTVLALYYGVVSGRYRVLSRSMVNGSWDSGPAQIDQSLVGVFGLPEVTAPSGNYLGTAPAITHLGGGNFLGAWVGVSPTGPPKTAQLFYSVYKPGSGWGLPSSIALATSYTTRPHYENLRLFSNGAGSAMVAVTYISNEETRSGTTVTGNFSVNDTRKTQVARFELETGWQSLTTLGNGCTPLVLNDTSTAFPEGCTSAPRGIVLASGAAVVVYQDQDNSGNFRLATAEYK